MDEQKMKQAQAAYKTLLEMLDGDDWHYERDDEALTIKCGARGEDLPIDVRIIVDPDMLVIVLLSEMPFTVPASRRDAISVAVAGANYRLADGSFDFNYKEGGMVFRLTSSFRESLVSKELFKYMVYVSCATVDEFNDKFFDIIKSDMSIEDAYNYVK